MANGVYLRPVAAGREWALDAVKVISCLWVILNHTVAIVYITWVTNPSVTWWGGIASFAACKAAVPLFLMISGALLLKREEHIQTVWTKRVLPNAALFFLSSALYYLNSDPEKVSFVETVQAIWTRETTNALWYMYLYLSILILLPLLRPWVKNLSKEQIEYFFLIWICVCGVYPLAASYIHWDGEAKMVRVLMQTMGNIPYVILGHYLWNCLAENHRLLKPGVWCGIGVTGLAAEIFFLADKYKPDNYYQTADNIQLLPIVMWSSAILLCGRWMQDHVSINNTAKKICCAAGGLTFGIYLMSDYFIEVLRPLRNGWMEQGMNPLAATYLLVVCVFATGMVITMVLKKIPGLKKVL